MSRKRKLRLLDTHAEQRAADAAQTPVRVQDYDVIVVSSSGGKDSVVALDVVSELTERAPVMGPPRSPSADYVDGCWVVIELGDYVMFVVEDDGDVWLFERHGFEPETGNANDDELEIFDDAPACVAWLRERGLVEVAPCKN